jgi:hypothetical protein
MIEDVPHIFEAIFQCTLEVIGYAIQLCCKCSNLLLFVVAALFLISVRIIYDEQVNYKQYDGKTIMVLNNETIAMW